MYAFLTQLTESPESLRAKQHTLGLIEDERQIRIFDHLVISPKLGMSVQGSYNVACEPELTLEDVSQYKTMEMALLYNNKLVTVPKVLPRFSRIDEIEQYNNRNIYEYVPVELLDCLYKELTNRDE
jgi:hypothetical protein